VESLVAGIALAAGTSVMDTTFAAVNETENNYLKPDELKSYLGALQAWKDCAGGDCALAEKEVRRLQAASQGRNYAADGACLDNPAACAAEAKILQADIAALEVQAQSLDPTEAATAANNLQQARKAYYSNLEWRAYAAQQELEEAGKGSWLASMSGQELYESGYLTQQEARDLQAMRRETLAAAFVPPALALGLKGGGSTAGQRIQSVAEEVKASALNVPKGSGSVLRYVDEPAFNPAGTAGSAQAWTNKARIKYVELPVSGKIRYVPPENYNPSNPLPRGPNNGYLDKFGNEWTKGPSRTVGQEFEWDVQLSRQGKSQLGWATRDGSHLNISLDGKITHK
jgi:hypothetical protein